MSIRINNENIVSHKEAQDLRDKSDSAVKDLKTKPEPVYDKIGDFVLTQSVDMVKLSNKVYQKSQRIKDAIIEDKKRKKLAQQTIIKQQQQQLNTSDSTHSHESKPEKDDGLEF